MNIEKVLLDAVNKFKITTQSGIEFWAPYLINFNNTEDPNVPRGLGKASPEEIKKSVDYIVGLFPNATAEEIKQKLVDGSLPEKEFNYKGIDCSGFVYYVMNTVYEKVLGKEIMDDLSVPKDDVLNGAFNFEDWKAAYTLTKEEAANLPEDVPVSWVVEKFKRKPVNLCRVAGLISDFTSVAVPIKSMQVGDLIDLVSREGYRSHVAIVCSLGDGFVELAHSGRKNPSEIGGVLIERVPFNEGAVDTTKLQVPRDFRTVRRLKAFIQG